MRNMRRHTAFWLSLMLMLTAMMSPVSAAGNWTTRGGNDQRTSSALDVFGWLGPRYSFAVDTGLSASQALNVDNVIYHMGGNQIWMIDPLLAAEYPDNHDALSATGHNPGVRVLATGINTMPSGEVRPSSSGLTFKEVGGKKFLFFGTGSNKVCALNVTAVHGDVSGPTPPPRNCVQLWGEKPITAVPLVFTTWVNGMEQDIVIISDKAGYVWAIQNLSRIAPGSEIVARGELGGWVTASPAATGRGLEFITAADGAVNDVGTGKVEKYIIQPANPATGTQLALIPQWGDRGDMPYGIADGMVVDGDFVYLADIRGGLGHRFPYRRF